MTEHELDDANVDSVGEQPAGAFVPEVVPSEIDPLELFTVPRSAFTTGSRLVAARQQFLKSRFVVSIVVS